ncbi:MAG: transcription-repair coupling factor [Bacilli bacterium]|nr:transcription-repair coupling factor [Bacilli bacterium]
MNFFDQFNFSYKKGKGITGLTDEFFCVYLSTLLKKEDRPLLVVVNSLFEANNLYSSLINYTDNVNLFPMDDFLTSEALAISPDLTISRLETLNCILSSNKRIVITNLMGYLRFLPTVFNYSSHTFRLMVNDEISPNKIIDLLVSDGYVRTTIVNKTGEFAVRGFVIDVFPLGEEYPVRIEFFGDEIESIRYFDVDNQKSIDTLRYIDINPYSEFVTDKKVDENHFNKQKYLPLYEEVSSIQDYLTDCITIYKDFSQLELSYKSIINETLEYRTNTDTEFKGNYMFDLVDVTNDDCMYYMSINNISNDHISSIENLNIHTINNFNEDSERINEYIRKRIEDKYTVLICLKKYQLRKILSILNMKVIDSTMDNISLNSVNMIESELNQGFIYENLVVLTANELFKKSDNKKKYHTNFKYGIGLKDISKLSLGDYVVHNVHGIGVYNGIKNLSLNGISKDYLEILYQGTDKIYVPVEKIDTLFKYSGQEGSSPKINKLDSVEWEKTKARVRKRINDMADQLLKLYAEREAKQGFAFSKDNEMSQDFENAFPYDLTKDQVRAISQIKDDMEKPNPMDRLLCGDVGFGKTEVAFVAAFKAMLDSKQVLFLCPTTILSSQHYDNAIERFKDFPVNIALLNRFTSPKEVNHIIEGLKDGTIDMVIGTHRLLSDDIKPKDLGLLIIDEEQRFGVAHKEKIKQYKVNVDVLTLTATPIPRTLQMSLVGIRSLSLIETPPINRFPVQTYVIEENNQIIKDAIYKELSRDGQVFILYNKVQSIEEEFSKISNLVPEARVTIVHGQMNKNELESRLYDFINHEYDVLICTTIIETGIDIPNVNTLIILDADRFGLSQLYQIRGRVGRSDKFAYAYLMYKPFKSLTETAVKRLNVIKEFTELGSGFSIATRDLSIRGAGDILGSEQAGFIDSVGIDLYLKMLNDEVNRRKNIIVEEDDNNSQPLINVSTHIEDSYVKEDELKIEIHKKINEIDSYDKFTEVKKELEDRFGKISEDLIIYMYEEWFEKLASKIKVKNVHQTKNSIELVFGEDIVKKLDTEQLFMDAFHITNMFRFLSKGTNMIIVLDIIKLEKHPIYYLVDLLNKILDNLGNSID